MRVGWLFVNALCQSLPNLAHQLELLHEDNHYRLTLQYCALQVLS